MQYCRISAAGAVLAALLAAPVYAANVSRWVSNCRSDKSRAAAAQSWQILPADKTEAAVYTVIPADYRLLAGRPGAAKARLYAITDSSRADSEDNFTPLPGNANIKQAIIPVSDKNLRQFIFRYQETSLKDGMTDDGGAAQYGKGEAELYYADKIVHYVCDITLEFQR